MANETLEQPAIPERVGVGSSELLALLREVAKEYGARWKQTADANGNLVISECLRADIGKVVGEIITEALERANAAGELPRPNPKL